MMQIVLHKFTNIEVEYSFINRTNIPLEKYIDEIRDEIYSLEVLRFNEEELSYLKKIRFLKPDFIEFLRKFNLNPRKCVEVKLNSKGNVEIIIKGAWLNTILFEVPILSILSEIYTKHEMQKLNKNEEELFESAKKRLQDKLELIIPKISEGFQFADFGTRRRFSNRFHDKIVKYIKENIPLPKQFIGTSNVEFAMKYDVKAIGTMAHEYLMAHQQLYGLVDHQRMALNNWIDEYRGELGIALTDTLTTDVFLADFDKASAKLFDGVRQDSGDPYEIGEKFLNHYIKLDIDPKTKTIVFSDGLDFKKALGLYNHFKDKIKVSFGIGTNITNDIEGITPPNFVIKMTKCRGLPVAKLSDTQGKETCISKAYLTYIKEVYNIIPNLK